MVKDNIRQALVEDLKVLFALDHVAHHDTNRQALIENAVTAQRAWIVEDSGEIRGYGIMSHEFFGRSFIDLVYIAESHRSMGYGADLIIDLEKQSKSEDLFTSTNRSNHHMQHVLAKLGYEQSGIIHNLDLGDPELVYVKRSVRTEQSG